MSSPIRNTFSSRSISSRSASRRAARNSFSGISKYLPLAGVEVAVELVDGRIGALVGEADGLLDLRLDAVLELLQLIGAHDAGLEQLVLEAVDGVAVPPVLLLLIGAVLVPVDDPVAPEPVVDRRDEARLGVGAPLLCHLRRAMEALPHRHAVEPHAR